MSKTSEKIETIIPAPSKHAEEVRKVVENCEQTIGLNFWIILLAHSLDYIEALKLNTKAIELLYSRENRLNKPGKKGFYSIKVKGLKFTFIAICDMGSNYDLWREDNSGYWKSRLIIVAYCETKPKLNIDNGQPKPWSNIFKIYTEYSDDYDDDDCELLPWANIIPEDWHNLIMAELKET